MTRRNVRLAGLSALVVGAATLVGAAAPDDIRVVHERKEVAGLAIVFGAEPEPALTGERQYLRWRVSSLDDEEPYTELSGAELTVTHDGEEFGPFTVRSVRRSPGQYQTNHIFTEGGEYESVLSFKKGEEAEVHTVDFGFRIRDRVDVEIPGRKGHGG